MTDENDTRWLADGHIPGTHAGRCTSRSGCSRGRTHGRVCSVSSPASALVPEQVCAQRACCPRCWQGVDVVGSRNGGADMTIRLDRSGPCCDRCGLSASPPGWDRWSSRTPRDVPCTVRCPPRTSHSPSCRHRQSNTSNLVARRTCRHASKTSLQENLCSGIASGQEGHRCGAIVHSGWSTCLVHREERSLLRILRRCTAQGGAYHSLYS
jgi:hypothetical protein